MVRSVIDSTSSVSLRVSWRIFKLTSCAPRSGGASCRATVTACSRLALAAGEGWRWIWEAMNVPSGNRAFVKVVNVGWHTEWSLLQACRRHCKDIGRLARYCLKLLCGHYHWRLTMIIHQAGPLPCHQRSWKRLVHGWRSGCKIRHLSSDTTAISSTVPRWLGQAVLNAPLPNVGERLP